ncbi:hypothetical protein HYT57_00425 [Candidatus Woesearchaeota archaeon]|nr:hypothetical protein [Candidatus Woesearchaeota archaeon]
MAEDEYLGYVRRFVGNIELDFPHDEFDLGDKLLLGQVARDIAQELREEREDRLRLMTAKHCVLVRAEMKERYGFKPRENLQDFF